MADTEEVTAIDGYASAGFGAGSGPGTIAPADDAAETVVRVLAYGVDGVEEKILTDLADLDGLRERFSTVWMDVRGLSNVSVLRQLAAMFDVHDLALEDVVNQNQLSKVEEHGESLYFSIQAPHFEDSFSTRQVDIFLRPGLVCTFQEQFSGWLDPVRHRIRVGRPRIRQSGADYLAYAIVDALVDHYFPVIENVGDRIEELEQSIESSPSPEMSVWINKVRHDLLLLKRAVGPIRDTLSTVLKEELPSISETTDVYFRDCHDHALQLGAAIDFERERARGLVDLTLAALSNRMNEVMKVLTIIATIFIPLGFIAGVYGMNFDPSASPFNMPELGFRFGYLSALAVMVMTAGILLLYFRSKGWIGGRGRRRIRGGEK